MTKCTPEQLQYAKIYREKNKEKVQKAMIEWNKRPENIERHKEYQREYSKKNAIKIREKVLEWQKANPERFQYNQVKARAKAENIPFDIDFKDLVWPTVCPVLGTPVFRSEKGLNRDNHPSVDKVIPELGYIKGNVCVISGKANRLKQESTIQDLEAVISYIKSFQEAKK